MSRVCEHGLCTMFQDVEFFFRLKIHWNENVQLTPNHACTVYTVYVTHLQVCNIYWPIYSVFVHVLFCPLCMWLFVSIVLCSDYSSCMQLLMQYPVMFEVPDLVHNALCLKNPVSWSHYTFTCISHTHDYLCSHSFLNQHVLCESGLHWKGMIYHTHCRYRREGQNHRRQMGRIEKQQRRYEMPCFVIFFIHLQDYIYTCA